MNPVVGVDVAKGESQIQAFMDKGEPFGRSEKVSHSLKGLDRLGQILIRLKEETGETPAIILEATGHYHRVLVLYLEREGYPVIVVNPLQAQKFRNTQLRRLKQMPAMPGIWLKCITEKNGVRAVHRRLT
nr:IS110 family transposase [Paenibacillus alvei]